MPRTAILTLITAAAIHSSLALGGAKGHGIFSILSVGESLMVKKVGEKYDLTYIKGMPAPYKITALGDDFIELSIGPMVQRIPVTSIRAIQVPVNEGSHR